MKKYFAFVGFVIAAALVPLFLVAWLASNWRGWPYLAFIAAAFGLANSPLKKGADPLAGLIFPEYSEARERIRPLFQRADNLRSLDAKKRDWLNKAERDRGMNEVN